MQGGDNGTPLQKDEPQAQNPPNGAFIDYYLRSDAAGDVTLEILDAIGHGARHVRQRRPGSADRRPRWARRAGRGHSQHVAALAADP